MLQNLRDNSRGVISFILIGFLVIIFALTGVEALFNWDTSANQAAKVNGEQVTEMDVARAIGMQKQQMLNTYGDQIPAEFLTDEYLRKPVIDNLVQRMVLSQAAVKSGMAVGNTYLSEQIATAPQFKNEAGAFDNNRYQQVLRNMGYTHSTYAKILSDEIVINQLQAGVSATAFATPSQLDDVVALSFQSRDLGYVILPAAKVRETIQVETAEIQSYYDANQQMFTSEEQVAVDYISLNVADLMKNISVTEEQVRKQFEQNQASFVAAPERQAAHILVEGDNQDKIKTIADKLAAGDDFAALAKEFSDDLGSKEQGGDLGFTKGDAFPAEFESALATLKVGEVSSAVKTDAGTHFIKLLAEKGSEPPSFEEQKASIEDELKRAEAENLFVVQLEKLREESYNAESLQEVAQALNLKAENSGLFERSKGKDLMANPKVVAAAFSTEVLQEGNSSDVIEIDSSNVVVLKKTDYKPSQVKPLASVQEQITNTLKDQKAKTLLDEQATRLIADLKSGGSFSELSKAAGVEFKQVKAATRSSADIDSDVLRHAFTMTKPSSSSPTFDKVMTAAGDLAVVALEAVTPGSYEKVTPEQKTAITAQLGSIYGKNDFSSYQKFLKDAADIVQ
ncbi:MULTISPECIES: SurA N-terminal domain-containing protein [Cellvibrio]|uniref:Periplasmic chaperone PpiD n=1 Tax=Cellvibrio fibrivorans TaxID=126350 RepID=A0ABU1UWQ3_9GAMM|nr:SurA N-terminal domain-containing protein [Cellvibrio fibrivorans]MDR7089586.1 peptidyl-prolyl cis-trans isomerase D [Cellvibrio fibrivorans]